MNQDLIALFKESKLLRKQAEILRRELSELIEDSIKTRIKRAKERESRTITTSLTCE